MIGTAPDGEAAKVITLANSHGMSASFMDIGATWLSCKVAVDDSQREVLLGVASLDAFYRQSAYMGCSVGRYANRIANGQYSQQGEVIQLKTNQAGNTLHGGPDGWSHRRWQVVAQSKQHVVFELFSPDGDQGFVGNVTASVCYTLTEQGSVDIEYRAQSDKRTPVCMTNHAYFNLQGADSGESCKTHRLRIDAEQFLPVNETGIPCGELASVAQTGFDFRALKQIGKDFGMDAQQQAAKGYDHAFLLTPQRRLDKACIAVHSPDDKVKLSVFTNQPAVQLYTGNWLAGNPSREGGEYDDYAGFALEAQVLPNSPNHPEWPQPSCFIEPGQPYFHSTRYQLSS